MLGWEVRSDVTMDEWGFRWLVVGPVGQDDVGLVLMPVPGPPDDRRGASRQLAELVAQGAGGTLFLDDGGLPGHLRRALGAGVGVQRPAHAAALRHRHLVPGPVSGNNVRLTQVMEFDPSRG